jgi:hypothetical protein
MYDYEHVTQTPQACVAQMSGRVVAQKFLG